MPGFGGTDFMFIVVPVFIFGIFILVIGTMFANGIKYAKDKSKPVIPVEAKIVSKRTKVWGEHSHTSYYVTFELINGERMELKVDDSKYGFLVEGDIGVLSFQGEIFVSFERKI